MAKTLCRNLIALPRGQQNIFLSWRRYSTDGASPEYILERRQPGEAWRSLKRITGANTTLDQPRFEGIAEYRIQHQRVVSEIKSVDTGSMTTNVALRVPLPVESRQCLSTVVSAPLLNNLASCYVVRFVYRDTIWLRAIGPDGEYLWDIDSTLPAKSEWGTHHVPFLVWDIDGDGRMEVVLHFGAGRWKDQLPEAVYEQAAEGEKLLVVDGATGNPKYNVPWPARSARVMMTVGYLSGFNYSPQIVIQDGTHHGASLTAIDGSSGQTIWQQQQKRPAGHSLAISDIDGDGVQEIICGGICYNGNGSVRWQAEDFGHTDMIKAADIDPQTPGLEIVYLVQNGNPGIYLVDCKGQTLWKERFEHAHFGWIARKLQGCPGLQLHAQENMSGGNNAEHHPVFLPDGSHCCELTGALSQNLLPVQWDENDETVFVHRRQKRIMRLDGEQNLIPVEGGELPESARLDMYLSAMDVVGDHRENIITFDEATNELIVLANPVELKDSQISPMESFYYIHDRSQMGSGYYMYLAPYE